MEEKGILIDDEGPVSDEGSGEDIMDNLME
jgi:hypothetical protein